MVDSVSEAMAELGRQQRIDNPSLHVSTMEDLEKEVALTLLPALLLFAGAGVGIGLVVYFMINLSDCLEDLINPYTLCDRVNPKLTWELIAHAVAVGALILEEIVDGDRLHWIAMLLALPGLCLRLVWWKNKTLLVDPTSVFNPQFASRLRTRWGLMLGWHGVTLLFGFVQLVMHMVLGLHRNMPSTMSAIGEHHVKRAANMQAMGGVGAAFHPMMFAH